MFRRVYLDNSATTPVDNRVIEEMLPFLTEKFGNASSIHFFGQEARSAVDRARHQVASAINARPNEIVFTSGGTESNNLAIRGLVEANEKYGKHIITSQIEHPAVKNVCEVLEKRGFEITYLPVYEDGIVKIEDVKNALREDTVLISIMTANNEIGSVLPLKAIGKVCKDKGVLFHTDAVQAVGKIPLDVEDMGIDLLSLTAHKIYGPKGVGALYVRKKGPRVRLEPQIDGGGHERGMRSGTLAVPMIVGLGAACDLARREMPEETARTFRLRERLRKGIMDQLPETFLNGHPTERLPGNANISFAYVEGEGLMMGIKDVAVSSGSACTSASLEPSYVLRALGIGDELAHSSIRFGIGRFNTEAEVDFVVDLVTREVSRLREMSPLFEMVQQGIDITKIEWAAH